MSSLNDAGTPENMAQPVKVYWQPGCSSCLKTKEFWAPIATIKESPRKKPVKKAGNIMAN